MVTLLGMLLLGTVGGVLSLSLLLQGMNFSQTSSTIEQMHQARALVNACAEEALEHVREEITFSGTEYLNLDTGSCSYSVVHSGGEKRTITAFSTVENLSQRIIITLDKIDPQIHLTSWREINDL